MALVSIITPAYNCKNTIEETNNRHEDYIFWLTILKRGIVTKGNHNVLATYVIHSSSKNSNKSKLVKSMYRVYHESQGFNWLKSSINVFRYALYSIRRNIKT